MKSLVSDLNLNEEAKEAIKVMQSGILAILDLVELNGDGLSGGGPRLSTDITLLRRLARFHVVLPSSYCDC